MQEISKGTRMLILELRILSGGKRGVLKYYKIAFVEVVTEMLYNW